MFHRNGISKKINLREFPFGPDSYSTWPLPQQPCSGIVFQAIPVHLQIKPGCSGHTSEAMLELRTLGPEIDTVCARLG